jgi:hypothetical protein
VIYADARHAEVTTDDRQRWLTAMIRALGQPRLGTEQRYVVKFDARHALDLPLVHRAFPEVPWVFLYRDPVEILVSHLNQPTSWTVPGIVPVRGVPCSEGGIAYPVRVIAAICRAALDALDERGTLVNYSDLPGAVFSTLTAYFGCTWTVDETEAMRSAAGRNAKRPGEPFAPDSARKQQEASEGVRAICERLAGGAYRGNCWAGAEPLPASLRSRTAQKAIASFFDSTLAASMPGAFRTSRQSL